MKASRKDIKNFETIADVDQAVDILRTSRSFFKIPQLAHSKSPRPTSHRSDIDGLAHNPTYTDQNN